MKVMLVNGSPHKEGSTYTALSEIAETLKSEDVWSEVFHIGSKPLSGCMDCRTCVKTGRCAINDRVNDFLDGADAIDGFVFGSPVYFASANGAISSFMDRAFFSALCGGRQTFRLKPAACVVAARRSGATATFDQLNKYFSLMDMPIIPSGYWNMVYGMNPEDVVKDKEGLQIMRTLARNMAWFLKCKEAGIKAGITFPHREEVVIQ